MEAIAHRIDEVRALATAQSRRLRFGLRIHVLTRDTDEQAWAEADRIQGSFDPAVVKAVQQRTKLMDSVGQKRMAALHAGQHTGDARSLAIGPNLWSGIGLVRQGVATALVGSHEDVADRLLEFHRAGSMNSSFPATRIWRRRCGSANRSHRASEIGWQRWKVADARRSDWPEVGRSVNRFSTSEVVNWSRCNWLAI